MSHVLVEQRNRQRLNWFRKALELCSVTEACVFFGIFRKTYYNWQNRYAASQWDRLSITDRSRRRVAWCLQRTGVRGMLSVYGIHRAL